MFLHEDSGFIRWKETECASKNIIIAATKLIMAHLSFFSETFICFLRFITSATIGDELVIGDENDEGIVNLM